MPRYDRYSRDLIALLQDVQRRAAAGPAAEMTCELLADAVLAADGPLRKAFLDAGGFDVAGSIPGADPTLSRETIGKVTLSAPLKRALEAAEAGTADTVGIVPVLSAAWSEMQGRLATLLKRRDGLAITTPIEWPASLAKAEAASSDTGSSGAAASRQLPPLRGPLGQFGRDLSTAEAGAPVVGRERETTELIAVLLKLFKPNAVLLGEAGVGKTAIVEGLAQRIREGRVPPGLLGKRIVELPVTAMVAGTQYRGQFEERMQSLIAQAKEDPSIILFIDEIHMLVGAGANRDEHGDASNILKPALSRGEIRVIGATTWSEYRQSIEADPALKRRFEAVFVDEPDEDAVAAILTAAMPSLSRHHGMPPSADIVRLVIDLSRSELPSRRFPDKALDVLDRSFSEAAIAGSATLEAVHVRRVVASMAGMSFTPDSPEFEARLASLEDQLKRSVLRQDDAVRKVARVVTLCKRRLDMRTHRPDGVFLFVGKSGVGKTALAKALAQTLLGSEDSVIRLDMTAFSESYRVSGLLGSPPGYVGSENRPEWLERLRQMPSAVLLLDELEKAHPEVCKVFLRAFDEGVIVDAMGQEHSLANVTVIATSNAHVDLDGAGFGFNAQAPDDQRAWLDGLQAFFPPEFLNRFDEIVPFEPLDTADIGLILRQKILPQARDKLHQDLDVELQVTDAGIQRLAELVDSDTFGARELERVFRNEVLLPAVDIVQKARNTNASSPHTLKVDLAPDGRLQVAWADAG